MSIIDLSHTITAGIPGWPGDPERFEIEVTGRPEIDGYFTRSFRMMEHFGTHVDAPLHFARGGLTVDRLAAHRLFGPAVVLEACPETARDADYALPRERVEQWERAHGTIEPGSIVLLRTGWAARWPDRQRYWNKDDGGVLHTPGFGSEAAALLIERGVSALGIDALSIDPGSSPDVPVHRLALGAGLYQIEDLADLSALPESGARLVVAPLKLEGGSGAPCRVFAFLGCGL